jgi:hypothetical protein
LILIALLTRAMNKYLLIVALALGCVTLASTGSAQKSPTKKFEEIVRFEAAEARQGVAVDAQHFYAVTDLGIGKYDKKTGKLVAKWEGPKGGPLIHLDSGVIVDGKLYASHSNYPQEPMTSSVEIWDAVTMQHIGSHSFGIMWGSCTWIDRHDGAWWAVFANYSRVFGPSQRPYGNTYWTTLVKFNDRWEWQQAWIFPSSILKRAEPMSISGGSWGPDGLLYVTGHDNPEVYAVQIPKAGSVLEHHATHNINIAGQGIAWDRSDPGVLWGIVRSTAHVVASRLK